MNKYIISMYIFLAFLCSYQLGKGKEIILYLLLVTQLLIFGLNICYLLKKKDIKLPKLILSMIMILSISLFFNIETIGNYVINIILIFNIFVLTKYKWNYIHKQLYYFAIIFNIFNVLLYIYLPKVYSTPKIIFGYELSKIELSKIGVAAMSQIAVYSLCSVSVIKNKLLKILIVVLSLYIIILGGKLTTILALFIAIMIYLLNSKLFILSSNKILKKILKIMLAICFFSSFIFYFFVNIFTEFLSVQNIFSGRNKLWIDYIDYIFKNKSSIFVGNGFFSESKMISYLSHPHNQYLTIFYTLGVFGFITFYLLYLKNINIIVQIKEKYYELFILFIMLIIQMCGDDYYILTIDPIGIMIIFLIYNIKYAEKSDNR